MREEKPRDPRLWQIAALSGLLTYGVLVLGIDIRPTVAAAIFAGALAAQALGTYWVSLPRFEAKSALISSLSLCLLMRTTSPSIAAAVAAITILSKFFVRARGKHIFNPTNFGLVMGLLLFDGLWVSPGQWGAVALVAFFLACAGFFVVHRSKRMDVTWAFLLAWGGILVSRALWLGDPWTIPWHQLQSGALLIFAFFMISDPKTTPDHRMGRILWASLIAAVAAYIQFVLYRPNALLYALVLSAPAVPLIDRFLPAARFTWLASPPNHPVPAATEPRALTRESTEKRSQKMLSADYWHRLFEGKNPLRSRFRGSPLWIGLAVATLLLGQSPASAFCGFYVAKAETDLYNQASKVVIVRDGDRTVLTMANDYQGAAEEFAMVIPVPTKLEREQIHVGNRAVIDHLDAYSAPRLVEYYDPDPCARAYKSEMLRMAAPMEDRVEKRARSLGVSIEASYSVGEYDILILSAKESQGLETWLREEGYSLPEGAGPVLRSYLKQGMRFFVAKVNIEAQESLGFSELRPLQIAFETPKFMLPIRLGTLNAKGPQELFVWVLTRTGRVETTNYRTVRLPSDIEIPAFVEDDFGDFYRDLFTHQAEKEKRRAVFLEYAWDMAWCDPCAADPLSPNELRELGVFWMNEGSGPNLRMKPQAQNVFLTRLHLTYTAESFPEDLFFQETGDRTNLQGRFILRRPWTGSSRTCPDASRYYAELDKKREERAQNLAKLTGWEIAEIRRKMELGEPSEHLSWWRSLWKESELKIGSPGSNRWEPNRSSP